MQQRGVPAGNAASANTLPSNMRQLDACHWRKRGTRWYSISARVEPASNARRFDATCTCPGCGRTIDAGIAHVVAWRADGVLGDQADLAARRHWHSRCWEIG